MSIPIFPPKEKRVSLFKPASPTINVDLLNQQNSGMAALNNALNTGIAGGIINQGMYPEAVGIPDTCGTFRIEKCDNGYLVLYGRYHTSDRHYCQDLKEAGEFVTAMCVKFDLEGK